MQQPPPNGIWQLPSMPTHMPPMYLDRGPMQMPQPPPIHMPPVINQPRVVESIVKSCDLPFVVQFDSLKPGVTQEILISGTFKDRRFDVNLQNHEGIVNPEDDSEEPIAFHLSVRDDSETIVRNTYSEDCVWGEEETDGEFPFTSGELFYMSIFIRCGDIEVRINNQMFCHYQPRCSFEDVNHLAIVGKLKLDSVAVRTTCT